MRNAGLEEAQAGIKIVVDADNQVIFNNETKKVVLDKGKKKGKNLAPGKAYLQKLYDDIDKR